MNQRASLCKEWKLGSICAIPVRLHTSFIYVSIFQYIWITSAFVYTSVYHADNPNILTIIGWSSVYFTGFLINFVIGCFVRELLRSMLMNVICGIKSWFIILFATGAFLEIHPSYWYKNIQSVRIILVSLCTLSWNFELSAIFYFQIYINSPNSFKSMNHFWEIVDTHKLESIVSNPNIDTFLYAFYVQTCFMQLILFGWNLIPFTLNDGSIVLHGIVHQTMNCIYSNAKWMCVRKPKYIPSAGGENNAILKTTQQNNATARTVSDSCVSNIADQFDHDVGDIPINIAELSHVLPYTSNILTYILMLGANIWVLWEFYQYGWLYRWDVYNGVFVILFAATMNIVQIIYAYKNRTNFIHYHKRFESYRRGSGAHDGDSGEVLYVRIDQQPNSKKTKNKHKKHAYAAKLPILHELYQFGWEYLHSKQWIRNAGGMQISSPMKKRVFLSNGKGKIVQKCKNGIDNFYCYGKIYGNVENSLKFIKDIRIYITWVMGVAIIKFDIYKNNNYWINFLLHINPKYNQITWGVHNAILIDQKRKCTDCGLKQSSSDFTYETKPVHPDNKHESEMITTHSIKSLNTSGSTSEASKQSCSRETHRFLVDSMTFIPMDQLENVVIKFVSYGQPDRRIEIS